MVGRPGAGVPAKPARLACASGPWERSRAHGGLDPGKKAPSPPPPPAFLPTPGTSFAADMPRHHDRHWNRDPEQATLRHRHAHGHRDAAQGRPTLTLPAILGLGPWSRTRPMPGGRVDPSPLFVTPPRCLEALRPQSAFPCDLRESGVNGRAMRPTPRGSRTATATATAAETPAATVTPTITATLSPAATHAPTPGAGWRPCLRQCQCLLCPSHYFALGNVRKGNADHVP